ncbi:alpha-L-rhamnosidase-related protein [Oleiharenicola lentus]|uniref:alpha-L-rhamnosidase-related protein n=1 Tax=Oleiharenicola lentus TaxID=2508720 RepID=UPI003F66773D
MSVLPFIQRASWIWSSEGTHAIPPAGQASPSHYQVRYFRRTFEIADLANASLVIHLSADSRYVFYCNGEFVGRGPAKGDINHHFYDTFELTPHLRAGKNVLAVIVLDMSRVAHRPALLGAPCSVMTYTGCFVLEGAVESAKGETLIDLQTDAQWRVATDYGHRFQNENTTFEGYLGYFEHRLSSLIPAGWNSVSFDDSKWASALVLFKAERIENRRDPASPYGLMPRMIPMLEEGAPQNFPDAYVNGGGEVSTEWKKLLAGHGEVTLQPGEKIDLVLDMGALTTAFPRISASGGAGSTVRLTYSEALRLKWGTPGATLMGKQQSLANLASHFADESTSWTFDRRGKVTGWCDLWEPAGREEIFEPLHWRAFRYVGLQITVGKDPLTLKAVQQRFTAYPYRVEATFKSSDAALDKIWEVGLHTMRMCSHETFEDCPHYEQMQYAGDTMITSKLAMFTTGDYRLSRQALYQFDWSRISDGLTQARFPSRLLQVIPAWSIHWITNIKDYFQCTGDRETLKDLLPGVRAVLDWYRRHTNENGLPAKLPFWNITDWCPWWPRGVVPGADTGATVIHSAQYINALDETAWMLRHLGREAEAAALAQEASELRAKAHAIFWSESEGLYFDQPNGPEVSQYGNAWAIVAGLAGERERAVIMKRFPNDAKLAPGSYFWWHTGFTALAKSGHYDDMPKHLGPWHDSIGYGLSTFVEENSYWRSLCHAWSAHPVLEFQQRILGVSAAEPGFARVAIKPHVCGLTHATGSVCTPRGMITVAWRIEKGRFHLDATVPAATPVQIELPDGWKHESAGGRVELSCALS